MNLNYFLVLFNVLFWWLNYFPTKTQNYMFDRLNNKFYQNLNIVIEFLSILIILFRIHINNYNFNSVYL